MVPFLPYFDDNVSVHPFSVDAQLIIVRVTGAGVCPSSWGTGQHRGQVSSPSQHGMTATPFARAESLLRVKQKVLCRIAISKLMKDICEFKKTTERLMIALNLTAIWSRWRSQVQDNM